MEGTNDKREPVILVVDDDRATRVMFRAALENDGYQVLEADGGRSALNIFQRANPDLILMDAAMPKMNGFETCCRLKELFFPSHAQDISTLLRYADQAMYAAKRDGGDRYYFHEAQRRDASLSE